MPALYTIREKMWFAAVNNTRAAWLIFNELFTSIIIHFFYVAFCKSYKVPNNIFSPDYIIFQLHHVAQTLEHRQ